MNEVAQWIVVAALVAAAVIFLTRRFRRAAKGCCAGCEHAKSCSRADKHLIECPSSERPTR